MAIKEPKKQMASAFQALCADIAAQTAFTGVNRLQRKGYLFYFEVSVFVESLWLGESLWR
jgi:hypothetical protein